MQIRRYGVITGLLQGPRRGNGKIGEYAVTAGALEADQRFQHAALAVEPTLRRRRLAGSRLFQIEELALRFGNGEERLYERILGGSAPASVLVVPMLDDDRVLLVREYAAGMERYELGLPKGRIEPGEAPLQAANREIMEEVGQGARRLREITTLSLAPAYIQHLTHVVLARDLYPSPLEGDEPEPLDVVNSDCAVEVPFFTTMI